MQSSAFDVGDEHLEIVHENADLLCWPPNESVSLAKERRIKKQEEGRRKNGRKQREERKMDDSPSNQASEPLAGYRAFRVPARKRRSGHVSHSLGQDEKEEEENGETLKRSRRTAVVTGNQKRHQ